MTVPIQFHPAAAPALPVPPPIRRNSDGAYDVEAIRAYFPVVDRMAYMNHAAISPLPAPAAQAMVDCISDVAYRGSQNFLTWVNAYNAVRDCAARTLHGRPDDIALIKNTSEGISTVAYGFPFQAGDNVVSCEDEFPANVRPWRAQSRRGVELRIAPLIRDAAGRPTGAVDPAALEALCDNRTRVLTLSAVEFSTGFHHDLARLGEFCRRRGILFFLDIIQAYGGRGFDLPAIGCGAAAADSHKWMLGPEGIGILYLDAQWRDRIEPLGAGWYNYDVKGDYLNYAAPMHTSGRKYECGTLNTIGIYGMLASMLLTEAIGLEQTWRHILDLTDYAVAQLAPLGYRPFAPRGAAASGVVSFAAPAGIDLKSAVARLERHDRVCVTNRSGRLRISPHLYNTKAEIDRLRDGLKDIAAHPPA